MRALVFSACLLADAAIAQGVGPELALDTVEMTPGYSQSTAVAVPGTALVVWNSFPTVPLTVRWVLIDADGGVTKPASVQPLGEYCRFCVSAAASPRGFLVLMPDVTSAGRTGVARLTPSGTSADFPRVVVSPINYPGAGAAAWVADQWWVLERPAGTTALSLVPETGPVTQNSTPLPGLNAARVALTSDGVTQLALFTASDGGLKAAAYDDAGALLSFDLLDSSGDQPAVTNGFFVAWRSGSGRVVLARWPDGGTVVVSDGGSPALAFDGTSLAVAWEQPEGLFVRRFSAGLSPLGDAAWVAAGREPSIASPAPEVLIVSYGVTTDAGTMPRARRVAFAPSATPVDGGEERDGGSRDAGSTPDGGGMPPADAGTWTGPRQLGVGCSTAPQLMALAAVLLARSRRAAGTRRPLPRDDSRRVR